MSFMGRDSVRQARAPAGFALGCMDLDQPWFPHLSNGVIVLSACGAMSGVRASESMVNRPTPWEHQALCWPHSPALARPQYPLLPPLCTSSGCKHKIPVHSAWAAKQARNFQGLPPPVDCCPSTEVFCLRGHPLFKAVSVDSIPLVPERGQEAVCHTLRENPEFGVPALGLGCQQL